MPPLSERLTSFSNAELKSLAENARRLRASLNTAQRNAAEDLWPHLQAELTARAAEKPVKAPPRKAKVVKKPAATSAPRFLGEGRT